MNFSVFSQHLCWLSPPFQRADFMGNQTTAAWDYIYLEPVARRNFSPVAQLQLWSREAKQRVRGLTKYWIRGKKANSCHKSPSSTSDFCHSFPIQLERKLFSACQSLAHLAKSCYGIWLPSRFLPSILTERQHLHLHSCFCRVSETGRSWVMPIVLLCFPLLTQPALWSPCHCSPVITSHL